jgi:glutathione S-transferase
MFERLLGKRSRAPVPPPVPMVLYTRPGCHLCDVMKAEIAAAGLQTPYELAEVDIEQDRELLRLHGRSIPVLEIGGEQAFEGRLERGELREVFERRAAEWRRGREVSE